MRRPRCFYGNAKIWVILGGYPKELMFGGKAPPKPRRRVEPEVHLTPTEALVSKREVEPTYGDF